MDGPVTSATTETVFATVAPFSGETIVTPSGCGGGGGGGVESPVKVQALPFSVQDVGSGAWPLKLPTKPKDTKPLAGMEAFQATPDAVRVVPALVKATFQELAMLPPKLNRKFQLANTVGELLKMRMAAV
jgi:hypothetical protein